LIELNKDFLFEGLIVLRDYRVKK